MPTASQQPAAQDAPPRQGFEHPLAVAGAGHRHRPRRMPAWTPRLVGDLLLLGAWQAASGRLVPEFVLPSPATIAQEIATIVAAGHVWQHFGATIRTIAVGYALAFAGGLGAGVLMARPVADAVVRPWIIVLLNTPGLVFVLITTMIFGFNPLGPITAVVFTSLPFVTVNVAEGVKAIPKELIDMGRAFDVTATQRIRHVVLPFLAPYTFAALRYGFSIAWKIAIFAELFGSPKGIGFMIRNEFGLFSMSGMLAWIVLFCIFALTLEAVLQMGMRRYFRWRPATAPI